MAAAATLHVATMVHVAVIMAVLSLTWCDASPQAPSDLASTGALVQALASEGATVTQAGAMAASAFPFFSVRARRIVLNGADVQVFEYRAPAGADSDAVRIAPSGTPIGWSQISWMDTPIFYKRDRLIVLYVGHSADIMRLLERVLGPPFARAQ